MSAAISELTRLADTLAVVRQSLGTLPALLIERVETELRATAEELRADWDEHTALLEEANALLEQIADAA